MLHFQDFLLLPTCTVNIPTASINRDEPLHWSRLQGQTHHLNERYLLV